MSGGTQRFMTGAIAAAATLLASAAFAAPAPAPSAAEIRLCTAKQDETPDVRIANCTAVIEKTKIKKQKADGARAISDCDEAIKLDSKHAEAFFNRSLAFRDRGDAGLAADDLEQVAKYDKRNSG